MNIVPSKYSDIEFFKHSYEVIHPSEHNRKELVTREHIYGIRDGALFVRKKDVTTKEYKWYEVKKGQTFLISKNGNTTDIKLVGYPYHNSTSNLEELKWVAEKTASKLIDDVPCEGSCIQCGSCCLSYHIHLEDEDIEKWRSEKRNDILSMIYVRDGDMGWINRDKTTYAYRCPWLRKNHKTGKHTCRIHDTKPRVCRAFPVALSQLRHVNCKGYNWRKYLPEEE